jgi:PST family polysaccharide transporter
VSIGRAAAHGVAWNMVFGISSRVLTLVATLILTRFIAPDDYGAVLAASIAVVTVGTLTSFAFGQYLIARKAPPDIAFQAAVVHFAIGVPAMAILVVFRDPIGDLLDTPEMGRFVLWYALAHLVDRARYVPERMLMRDLRFRTIALINGLGEVAFTVSALSLAPAFGPYAIIIAVQVRAVVTAALFFAKAPRAEWLVPSRMRRDAVRDLFHYGLPIMIAAAADRAATRWDNLIVSKLFGPAVMAGYNLAYSLAEMPISNVAEHIGEVLMPSFSRMEDAQRRSAVVRAAAMMALVVSPLGVGLAAIAPTLVGAFFDARWQGMAPLLVILSVMTVFRPITWSAVAYLQAVGKTRLIMYMSVFRAIVVLPLVAVCGYLGGPEWACVGGGIGYAVHAVTTVVATGWATGMPTARYLVGAFQPLLACVPMYFAVRGVDAALSGSVPVVAVLAVDLVVGGIVYVASAFVLVRSTARELVRLGKDAVRRRPGPAPSGDGA